MNHENRGQDTVLLMFLFFFFPPPPLHLKFAIEACAMFVAMTSMISRFSFVCFQ